MTAAIVMSNKMHVVVECKIWQIVLTVVLTENDAKGTDITSVPRLGKGVY